MDILVRVKIPIGIIAARRYADRVINLRYMTQCNPCNTGINKNAARVYFTDGSDLLIQVKYENFIILLKKSYGEKFIEMEKSEEKFEKRNLKSED